MHITHIHHPYSSTSHIHITQQVAAIEETENATHGAPVNNAPVNNAQEHPQTGPFDQWCAMAKQRLRIAALTKQLKVCVY